MTRPSPDHVDEILAQWRRERPDLDASPIGVFGRLSRADRLVDTALAEGIAGHGLQPGWFDLLAALRRQGPPFELNPTQLTEATLLSSGGTTKRLDRLADAGLIERLPDPHDRRGTLVRLTQHGKRVIDRALRPTSRTSVDCFRPSAATSSARSSDSCERCSTASTPPDPAT